VFARSRVCSIAALVVGMLLGTGILVGHHSFAMFDTAKSVTLSGTVTSFEWTNPHAYIEIDVPGTGGAPMKHWSVEMGSPSILMQSGWTFKTLKAGDKISLNLNPLRDGTPGGLLLQATTPDGTTLGNGPGRGPAAPTRGTTPTSTPPATGR
jgi:hypothetical protein